MCKVIFTVSGLEGPARADIQAQGQQLGLVYQPAMNQDCTHLVSDTVLSDKYIFAVSNCLPVVHPDWVRTSAARGRPEPEAPYLLPPFYGLKISVTGQGFKKDIREYIARTIADLGGTLAPQLTAQCTHLIAEIAQGTEKLMMCCSGARELAHIRVVSCGWLDACLRTGVCIDESPFLMTRPEPCLSSCVFAVARGSASSRQTAVLAASAASTGATRVECIGLATHVLFGDVACTDPLRFVADAKGIASGAPSALLVSAEWLIECDKVSKLLPVAPFLWRNAVESERELCAASAATSAAASAAASRGATLGLVGAPNRQVSQHHRHHSHHFAVSSHRHHSNHVASVLPGALPRMQRQLPSSRLAVALGTVPAPQASPLVCTNVDAPPPRARESTRDITNEGAQSSTAVPATNGAGGSTGRLGSRSSRGYFDGWCVLQVMSDGAIGLDESHTRVLREAVSHGGLKLLSDSIPPDVDLWVAHDGPAAVLAPHGPDGLGWARRRATELHENVLNRRRVGPNQYACHELECVTSNGSQDDGDLRPPACVSLQWLTDCVRARKCLSPSAHPLYSPCTHRLPLPDFHEQDICISQYHPQSDERQLAIDVIKLLGARYKENFRRGHSLLVCPHIGGKKCNFAEEWDVPMVTLSWLNDCFEAGSQVAIQPHHRPHRLEEPLALPTVRAGHAAAPDDALPVGHASGDAVVEARSAQTSPGNGAPSSTGVGKSTPLPKQSPAHPPHEDEYPTEIAAHPPQDQFAAALRGAPQLTARPLHAAASNLPLSRLSARPDMALRPGFPVGMGDAVGARSRLSARTNTVAEAEALLAQLPDGNQLDGCTKAPLALGGGGTGTSALVSGGAPVNGSAPVVRRPMRRAEVEGGGHNNVTTFLDPASQQAQEVRYVDPEQREAQGLLRSRMLASPEPDSADSYHNQNHLRKEGVPRASAGRPIGVPGASSSGGSGAPPSASTGNIFSAGFARGAGSSVASQPLRQKQIAIIGYGGRAEELAATARRLGANVVELRQGAACGGGKSSGTPYSVPMGCSAAIFASLACVEESYESLAVLSAGLVPLKPSYLEELAPSAREPLPERQHEWSASDEGVGAGVLVRTRALLALARRQQSGKTRLFEGWRVALVPGSATAEHSEPSHNGAARCPLTEAEVVALLGSGGAHLEANPAEADAILGGDASAQSIDAPESVPRYSLNEWMRLVVGGAPSLDHLRPYEPRARTGASAADGTRAGRAGSGAAVGSAQPADDCLKRRTRHSASDPKAPLQAPSMKRQRIA